MMATKLPPLGPVESKTSPWELRTQCRRGHPYIEGSFAWRSDGTRRCIVCQRLREQQRNQRAREVRTRAWKEPDQS